MSYWKMSLLCSQQMGVQIHMVTLGKFLKLLILELVFSPLNYAYYLLLGVVD